MTPHPPRFAPEVFETSSVDDAKRIILTPERGTTTESRWELETEFLIRDITEKLAVHPGSLLVDYGCGIGRLARDLIRSTGCMVIGVDASDSMRRLARDYVDSDRFIACSPAAFDSLVAKGLRADHAFAIWVLQHCHRPHDDIARIESSLGPTSRFYVLNNIRRAVPTDRGWVDDGIDVGALLQTRMTLIQEYRLPQDVTSEPVAMMTSIRVLSLPTCRAP